MRQRIRTIRLAILLALLALGIAFIWRGGIQRSADLQPQASRDVQRMADQLGALQAQTKRIDETVWAKERLAQRCGEVFDRFWDALNGAGDKLKVAGSLPFDQLTLPRVGESKAVGHGMRFHAPSGIGTILTSAQWQSYLSDAARQGWALTQSEFRHVRFDVTPDARPAQSTFYFLANLLNESRQERAALEGNLIVYWNLSPAQDSDIRFPRDTPATVHKIDASGLTVKTYQGPRLFQPIFSQRVAPPAKSYFIDPLIVYDLDRDGISEVILASSNLLLRQKAIGEFHAEPLCKADLGLTFCAAIADYDRNGTPDLLCAKFEGLFLFEGSAHGTFERPGRPVWTANPRLKYGQVITSGDIDQDGDLDVWLAQYKAPYERGQMPTPYFDANDGHPSFLLRNDGHGNFSDATIESGLGGKRSRRTYSASFVDLDGDIDLDLAVVSDFAGLDLYMNDGRGRFAEVTKSYVSDSYGFGMAHAVTDFNSDGLIDLLMIGMNSPTADRLRQANLLRPNFAHFDARRPSMTYGNRLFLQTSGAPRFQQTEMNHSVARSGWSWGCSGADFNNDGFPDLYVANGHETGPSVREYEPEFWLHDIYIADSRENIVTTAFFSSQFGRTRGQGFSYGGYEKNRLYLNQEGREFIEVGHLAGVALEQDSRNVVADDLDGDGRMDLLVTTFESWPEVKQTIQMFKNALPQTGNWIGLKFHEEGNGISPIGVRAVLHSGSRVAGRQILTGDSYRSQHANTVHFGLGSMTVVENISVQWTQNRTTVIQHPKINCYHVIKPGL